MTSPPAGRPLLLPEEPFTKEDIDAVKFAIADARFEDGSTEQAVAVLKVLVARSLLLPASAEHREEWTYADLRHGELRPVADDHLFDSRREVEQHVAFFRQQFPDPSWDDFRIVRRVITTGPWTGVDGDDHE